MELRAWAFRPVRICRAALHTVCILERYKKPQCNRNVHHNRRKRQSLLNEPQSRAVFRCDYKEQLFFELDARKDVETHYFFYLFLIRYYYYIF